MLKNRILSLIILAFCAAVQTAFAQEPERFAVYVSGAGDAGVNKSMGDKLAASISHGGSYAEIAKRHEADFLCAVSITEALGSHSISARLFNVSPAQAAGAEEIAPDKEGGSVGKGKNFSLGIRTGMNLSHLYAEYSGSAGSGEGTYESIGGFQAGFAFDFALSDAFHLQPGLMYIQKGAAGLTSHNIEIPLLLSLKFSALRINAGPYFDICVDGPFDNDIGINSGFGFDIGRFYIGMFYDYGLAESYSRSHYNGYSYGSISGMSRALGFNFGVNL